MSKIELRDVTMSFGDFKAVENIDLEIEDGEYITVLGPSGCGKTMFISKVIDQGRDVLGGGDLLHRPDLYLLRVHAHGQGTGKQR